MFRWGLFLVVVIVNTMWALSSQGTCYVSWAQIVPKEINCSLCLQPEVQAALIKAVEIGREQMCHSLLDAWVVVCLALFNLVIIAVLLFFPALTHHSSGTPNGAP